MNPYKRYSTRLKSLSKSDSQLGALTPKREVHQAACEPGLPLDTVVSTFLEGYADRPALGERIYDVRTDARTGATLRVYRAAFATTSYGKLLARIQALAMAWRKHPQCEVKRDDHVCIIGYAGIDFSVIDIACAFAKAVTVPLSSGSSDSDLAEILSTVQPAVLATSILDVSLSVEHAIKHPSIKVVIVFEYDVRVTAELQALKEAQAKLRESSATARLFLLDDLIAYGEQIPFSFLPMEMGENEKTAMIIHSSGSTGKPKGACISARAMINTWQGQPEKLSRITVILAPFNHNMGRNEMYETLNAGGTAYFTLKPDMSTLFEDIRLARPTILVFFPRILELIYQHFLIETAKRFSLRGDSREVAEQEVTKEMGAWYLGNRLLFAAVASAPVSPKVKQFIAQCFDIHLANGYGMTETASGGLAMDGKVNRKIVLEYKLKDVKELGYLATDKPYPRGEFRVKTRFGIKEYYKQPEATAQLFDADGFLMTGDIVEELAPDHISIIDRKTNVLKLAQGEYVALGMLEKVFKENSVIISQIYLYGTSQRSYLLAVIVPDLNAVRETMKIDLAENELRQALRDEIHVIAKKERLKSFEIPRDFIIETEPFTQKNGLLSSVNKYRIPALKQKYAATLEAIYEKRDQDLRNELESLTKAGRPQGVKETLRELLQINIGGAIPKEADTKTFYELGGDSLAAAMFSMHIEEVFNVSLGGDVLLSPKGNILQWTKRIENARQRNAIGHPCDFMHGEKVDVLHCEDLRPERFLGKSLVLHAVELPKTSRPPQTVLLTGASGFLGHVLCLKWLEELARIDGKLICLVRAGDDATARHRLDAKFAGAGESVWQKYRNLSRNTLEVLAGDTSEPLLGLNAVTFERLANETDAICHAGAMVNHRLSYRHLFAPNVQGTGEVLRLALTGKKKAIDFISTIGINGLLNKENVRDETAPLQSSLALSEKYAAGYIATKWASEHLLQRAHHEAAIDTHIFRCDIIMPDQHYDRLINGNDMLTRLLYSMIATKLAPKSFYGPHAGKDTSLPRFAGIPVNIVADAIIFARKTEKLDFCVYNACNYLQDAASLDDFVDWMEKAGYILERESDYKTWHEKVEGKLDALPLEQKKLAMTSVLDAFADPFSAAAYFPDCDNFKALVRKMLGGVDFPNVSEAYMLRYFSALQ